TAPPAESSYRKEIEGLAAAFGNEYVHARLAEKDPAAAARIHPNNLKKIIRALEVAEKAGSRIMPFENSFVKTGDYQTELVCLNRERPELYARINARVDSLVEMGLVSEVESLLAMGLSPGDVSMKGIGYKEVISYLNGECDLAEAVRMVKQNTRNYAKRQVTWFKRCGGMKWFNLSEYENDKEGAREVVGWLQEKR
ncbi:MAG: tRNA (adenosine(37)-N6)-dimethylallyltransferase MiaA, partial [Clostridiales bacterium]|nr:tRNA (adenosine(37)-N6)-dimethylallyltransferase MiaA [Clostridiales bacterium]